MKDSQNLNSDWLKPFLAVFTYFKFTGIDILDKYYILKFLKVKYIYFVLHVIITFGVCRGVVAAAENGVYLIDLTSDLSYVLVSIECGSLLYLHFFYSEKKIKTFISKLGKKWRDDGGLSANLVALRRNELKSIAQFNYVYFTGVEIFIHMYMLIPITCVIVKKNIFKEDVVLTLPFRVPVPFDYESDFLYSFCYGIIYVLTVNVGHILNGSLLLLTVCMSELRVLFDLLQNEFKDIFNSKDDFNMDKIKRTIQKHSELQKLTSELSSAFGAIFAIHILLLSAVICFLAFTSMINGNPSDLKNLLGSIISIATVFHCCYQGQLLADSVVDVGRATYDSEWYSLSCEHKKIVLIIILRSQRMTYINSTSYTHISLKTFLKIMNMAWSLISLITGMYKEY